MKRHIVVLVSLVILLSGCTSVRVITDTDKRTDFSKFQTYAFMQTDNNRDNPAFSQLTQNRIKEAIRVEMNMRGYQEVTSPDLWINIFVTVEDRREIISDPWYYGGWRYRGWYTYNVQVNEYKEGTLFIDLIDSSKDQLVWQGMAVGPINYAVTKNREEKIREAVKAIFEEYPHEAGKMNVNSVALTEGSHECEPEKYVIW